MASGGGAVRLSEISEFISCPICQGFLIEATTVSECLHSFCRHCIVRHIKNNNNECPKCNITIHERRPLDYIIYDRSKQDIVYKLVPQLYASERESRVACRLVEEPEALPSNTLQATSPPAIKKQPTRRKLSAAKRPPPPPPPSKRLALVVVLKPLDEPFQMYLKCPLQVAAKHLRKLLVVKYQLQAHHKLTLLYKGDPISDDDQISNLAPALRFCIHYEIT